MSETNRYDTRDTSKPASSARCRSRRMSAIISECGRYRYRLERTIPFAQCPDGRAIMERMGRLNTTIAFVMVNPSTADAETDDATIRRCIGFASRFGYERLLVGNLFAYRATDVRELRDLSMEAAVGVENGAHLYNIMRESELVIAAWGPMGKLPVHLRPARHGIESLAALTKHRLRCLGTAKDGQPRHPLMLRADAPLELWSPV